MYERAGKMKGHEGSITMIPILTMPEDDKTHPILTLQDTLQKGKLYLAVNFIKRYTASYRCFTITFSSKR